MRSSVQRRIHGSNKFVIIVLLNDSRLRLALALLGWCQPKALALRVEDLVLVLDKLDSLLLFELLDGLGERDVEDLAAFTWTAHGVKGVHDAGVGWRRRRVRVDIVGLVGRDGRALEHVVLASNLGAVLQAGYSALGVAAVEVEIAVH